MQYQLVVLGLYEAAKLTVPQIPANSLHHFWNDELDDLKAKSVFWHALWRDNGCPRSGSVFLTKCQTALRFKKAIRNAIKNFDSQFDEDIIENFISKDFTEFWRCWQRKCHSTQVRNVNISGCSNDKESADSFASYFKSVFFDSSNDQVATAEFVQCYSSVFNGVQNTCPDFITVELVDRCIRQMKRGKAAGPDNLTAEHVIYAHPCVVILLCDLFQAMIESGYVPDDFGKGIIIPLVKDRSDSLSDITNYRAITISPIVSKLFELIILKVCNDYLLSDSLQFGFKVGVGCAEAIYTVRTTIDYFISNGSTVYVAALDIFKAYDKVNHYKLFTKLIEAGLPKWLIDILFCWYQKLVVRVRWNGCYSFEFCVHSGVRQGSSLSPSVFNVFINQFLTSLRSHRYGCHISSYFVGAVLYADDLILLSASVSGLQRSLNVCYHISLDLGLNFNGKKSFCIAFGPGFNECRFPLKLGDQLIEWKSCLKYLGVVFITGAKLTVDTSSITRKYYAACNSVFSKASCMPELTKLHLLESYCLPILTYVIGSLNLSKSQCNVLNVCWNNAYRKVFGFNRCESVKSFMCGLGKLDFLHIHKSAVLRFHKKLSYSGNSVIKMLLRTPVSCKYVHCFVNELDVDLSKPGYVLDSMITSHFCAVALT